MHCPRTIAPLVAVTLFFGCRVASGESLMYADSAVHKFLKIHIHASGNGTAITTINEIGDSMKYTAGPDGWIVTWNYRNGAAGTAITAVRNRTSITAKGVFKGKPYGKTYAIDENPWFEVWGLGVEAFAKSDKKSEPFLDHRSRQPELVRQVPPDAHRTRHHHRTGENRGGAALQGIAHRLGGRVFQRGLLAAEVRLPRTADTHAPRTRSGAHGQ